MPNQKRVFIIHGWEGSPKNIWFPWLIEKLKEKGFIAEALAMPNADDPEIQAWIEYMQSVIKNPNKNTILVGHSLGSQAILRYLAELPEGIQVKKAILVAPVLDEITNRDFDEDESGAFWLKTPFNTERAKKSAKEIIGLFSDDDKWIPLSSEKSLREKFGARTIIERNKGHYIIKEVPQVLKEIIGKNEKN
jgi:uncharacterized protein